MSRVGKKPVPLAKGVKVTAGAELLIEGPKGKLTVPLPSGIRVKETDGRMVLERDADQYAALHGLTRALLANAVTGVTAGFTRELDVVGTGYNADVKGGVATFRLGYSHPIDFVLPPGIEMKVEKQTHIVLSGIDKQLLGQVAANMRALRPPDPYKNKGVRYTGEALRKKAGKAGAGGKGK